MYTPRSVEFRSLKQLLRRLHANRDTERDKLISIEDGDLPKWQRQLVWTNVEMGFLCLSILRGYPIGQMVLWKKSDGVRVPIDGRQRLTAIKLFFEGHISLPDLPQVEVGLRGKKYKLQDDDPHHILLSMDLRDHFDDYEPSILEHENIQETVAKDIFVKLQGGKSLTKTEIRAALPGLVTDFVGQLADPPVSAADEEVEEEEAPGRHRFFSEIQVRNNRKAHRNICDILLHEFLYPDQDKHWSSLDSLYLDKAQTLTKAERVGFKKSFSRFHRNVRIKKGGTRKVHPALRSAYLILTYYRAWRALDKLALPSNHSFVEALALFETTRKLQKDDRPYVNFNAALSNAGYAQNRCAERHRILMNFMLDRVPDAEPRDPKRGFTEDQKVAIWSRASGRCEWKDEEGNRCLEEFPEFRAADADHVVKWKEGGRTSLENGRLLCPAHNRAAQD